MDNIDLKSAKSSGNIPSVPIIQAKIFFFFMMMMNDLTLDCKSNYNIEFKCFYRPHQNYLQLQLSTKEDSAHRNWNWLNQDE